MVEYHGQFIQRWGISLKILRDRQVLFQLSCMPSPGFAYFYLFTQVSLGWPLTLPSWVLRLWECTIMALLKDRVSLCSHLLAWNLL